MEEPREELALETPASPPEEAPAQEKYETVDYVRELFLNSEAQKKTEHKRLVLLRVCVALLSVLTAAAVIACAIVVPAVLNVAYEAQDTLEVLQKVDVDSIMTDIDSFTEQAGETFTSVSESAAILNTLDMESLNETIGELKTAVDNFSQIDVVALNEAIQNLNDTVEPLARFFGKK
jgi:hypothetical protein